MLPVAAHLAVLVHGDGGPEDVREVLEGLDETQKNALIVVLAGLVDPEQRLGKALGWLDFNEHGDLTVPSWSEQRSVRDLAPEPAEVLDEGFVDEVAVTRFIRGLPVEVTDTEFLAAVQQCVAMGMTLADINAVRAWPARTAENWVNRIRKQYQRGGREFPSLAQPRVRRFSEEEVITIRERSANGATDVELALSFGTTRETIRSVCRGQSYKKYGGPIRAPRSAKNLKASRDFMCGHSDNSQAGGFYKPALTPQERDETRQRADEGESKKISGAEYQVPVGTIRNHAA
jgi:hypothetical protein